MADLECYREEINNIDKEMAALFEKRMRLSRKIAEYKREYSLPIKNEAREAEISARSRELIKDADIETYYVGFEKKVIELSCDYQTRLLEGIRVGYSGVEGAYAYIAARRMFPTGKLIGFSNFEPVYRAVENGDIDCAVLPIENSYAGDVGAVMDLLFQGSLYVNRVSAQKIEHCLIAKEGTDLSNVKTVLSHEQAMAQCDKYIKERGFRIIEQTNTAVAAKFVKESPDMTIAAIASEETAELFGLKILEKNIKTADNNSTRFAVVSRTQSRSDVVRRDEDNSFILMYTVKDEAGALAQTLDIVASHGFNMRSLRSRPMKGLLWKYYFYLEAFGNINTRNGEDMLRELSVLCNQIKLVGTFSSDLSD